MKKKFTKQTHFSERKIRELIFDLSLLESLFKVKIEDLMTKQVHQHNYN